MAVMEAVEKPPAPGTAPPARPSRDRPGPTLLPAAVAGAVAAAAAAAIFGTALVNGDTIYHLIWGRELAAGELSTFATGPTPHPLPLLAGAVTSLLGDAASYTVTYVLFGPLSLGLLVAACWALAGELTGTRWSGALAAAVLVTSTPVLANAATARYDVLFAALVVAALVAQLRRPASGALPMVLLVTAGLLRPEGWVLAGAYAAYRWWRPGTRRLAYAGAAVAAPAAWVAMDLLVMGDPFYSWHVTESGSDTYYRQFTPWENLEEAWRNLLQYVGLVPLGLALVAAAGARRQRRLLWPLAALAVPVAVFLALLARGTASSERYLLLPACLIAVLAAVAAGRRVRTPAAAMGVTVAIVLLLYGLGPRLDNPAAIGEDAREAAARNASMGDLVERPGVARAIRTCPLAGLPTGRMIPVAAFHSGRSPARWRVDDRGATAPGLYLAPASDGGREFLKRRRFDDDDSWVLPSGLVAGPRSRDWRAYGDPAAACAAGLF